jgi:hypothetical protein
MEGFQRLLGLRDQSIARSLSTHRKSQRVNPHRHSNFEWDSNPRTQHLKDRKQFILQAASHCKRHNGLRWIKLKREKYSKELGHILRGVLCYDAVISVKYVPKYPIHFLP